MILIPTVYSLFSYFLSPHLFIHLSNRNSLVLFTPFPTVVHYTKSTVPVPPRPKRNISETEIKEFLDRLQKKKWKSGINLEGVWEY
jgi:hypothetical protein